MHPSPVAQCATELGLNVMEAASLKGDDVAQYVHALHADLGVVVAYGGLVPAAVLDMPRHGWINLHFSDLPRWRGAAPVQWAIRAGDTTTASCVFQLEETLDTGDVYSRVTVDIADQNAGELLESMANSGAEQLLEVVNTIENGTAIAVPQTSQGVTVARMLTHADGFVDFAADAATTERIIRSVTPNPGAWTLLPDGRRMKIAQVTPTSSTSLGPGRLVVTKNSVEVGCSDTCLRLDTVAPAGKGWMDGAAWARGARPTADFALGRAKEA